MRYINLRFTYLLTYSRRHISSCLAQLWKEVARAPAPV